MKVAFTLLVVLTLVTALVTGCTPLHTQDNSGFQQPEFPHSLCHHDNTRIHFHLMEVPTGVNPRTGVPQNKALTGARFV